MFDKRLLYALNESFRGSMDLLVFNCAKREMLLDTNQTLICKKEHPLLGQSISSFVVSMKQYYATASKRKMQSLRV